MMILCYGSDAYRLREATAAGVARLTTTQSAAVVAIDGTADDASDRLEELLKYPSFFGDRRLAMVSHIADIPDVATLLKKYNVASLDDVVIVASLHLVGRVTADTKKLLTHLQAVAQESISCEPLEGQALAAWITAFCTDRDRSITPGAIAKLTRHTVDTWQLSSELEKLCSYAPATIDEPAVAALVPATPEADQWELSNALAAYDKRAALRALWRQLTGGVPEPLVVGSIASALRTLLAVGDLASKGTATRDIASATGLHPYVVSKHLSGSRAYDPQALLVAHQHLAQLDRQAKSGLADATDGLFSILLAL